MSDNSITNNKPVKEVIVDLSKQTDELNEYDEYILKLLEGQHPLSIIPIVFASRVMGVISSDHHKHRDGILRIEYDYYAKEWSISHPGYVRGDIMETATSYTTAVTKFLDRIERANARELYTEIENHVNKQLGFDYNIELYGGSSLNINIYKLSDLMCICSLPKIVDDMTINEILKFVKKEIKEHESDEIDE